MAPPVNKPGHPPDATALIVPMETDVTSALIISKDMVAGSVSLISREMSVDNARRTTTERIVVMVSIYIKK